MKRGGRVQGGHLDHFWLRNQRWDWKKNTTVDKPETLKKKIIVKFSKQLIGRLGPRDRHVTFFASKEVSWIPLSMMWRFLDQRMSVGPPCQWRDVFCTKGGRLGPPVCDVTEFLWFSRFEVDFHGSRCVFMVFHDSRLVFHGYRWIFMVLHEKFLSTLLGKLSGPFLQKD